MLSDMIIYIMEWIGTVSFAVSGALVAIGCSLDIFGVVTVGCITAVGGGIIRDILLGNVPPKIFDNPIILLVALITSVLVFVIAYIFRKRFKAFQAATNSYNVFFDALGLAAFSITGVETVCISDHSANIVLAITLGVITGVGGGIIRDVLVNEKPYVLTKHIYAVVSVVSCSVYYLLSFHYNHKIIATFFVLIFTVLIRLLAAKFRWGLPKIKIDEEK
ncbi:MAG: trimeric intracellular cation channel family protein [Clostridia bacterium]|nr:trimeric intracellular cation channel family protein [Clostridia bacterium]